MGWAETAPMALRARPFMVDRAQRADSAEKSPWKGRSARLRRSARRMEGDRASVSAEEEALERLMSRGGEGHHTAEPEPEGTDGRRRMG